MSWMRKKASALITPTAATSYCDEPTRAFVAPVRTAA